jgi:flagellar L-ring protein precursor FlgH
LRVGDIVTVIVQEDQTIAHSVASSLSKATSSNGQIDALNLPHLSSGLVSPVFKGALLPQVQYSSARTMDGKGSYSLQGSMQTQITAVVMEVLPNRNLVVEGSRLTNSVEERVTMRISGIVRPEDISNTNTVLSTSLAQGKIVFESSGPVANSNRYGWFEKFMDHIWPF